MKKNYLPILFSVLIFIFGVISLSGCPNGLKPVRKIETIKPVTNAEITTFDNDEVITTSDDSTETTTFTTKETIKFDEIIAFIEPIKDTVYIEILKSTKSFFNVNKQPNGGFLDENGSFQGEYVTINEMFKSWEYHNEITKFTIIQLEDDDMPIVVMEFLLANQRYVLRYNDGVVFGFHMGFRGFRLRQNGIYKGSSGAAPTRIYRMTFPNGICVPELLPLSYDEFMEVDDVVWHKFPGETFWEYVSAPSSN